MSLPSLNKVIIIIIIIIISTFLCLARDKKIKSYSLLTNSELKKLLGSEIEEKKRISNP